MVLSFVNSIIPRVLMGVCVGWVYRAARRLDRGNTISYYIGGLAAPVLNTLFYMTVLILIFLNAPTLQVLLGEELMAKFQDNFTVCRRLCGIQAVIEAAVGCVISGSVCKALRSC